MRIRKVLGGIGAPAGARPPHESYHLWYYDHAVWKTTTFLGVPCLKSVSDLWSYQEILADLRPSLVVELGTWLGGSALYFAVILQQIRPDFKVLSVDLEHARVAERVRSHPGIELLTCSSTGAGVARRIVELRARYPGPMFVILDSAHEKPHVLSELLLLRAVTRAGDYAVVEDANLNGHPVEPAFGEGPGEAIEAYEAMFPEDYRHDRDRERKFGFTFAPGGFLIRQ